MPSTSAADVAAQKDDVSGKRCAISGSGNVAQYAAEKIIDLNGKVVTFHPTQGFIYDPEETDVKKRLS